MPLEFNCEFMVLLVSVCYLNFCWLLHQFRILKVAVNG